MTSRSTRAPRHTFGTGLRNPSTTSPNFCTLTAEIGTRMYCAAGLQKECYQLDATGAKIGGIYVGDACANSTDLLGGHAVACIGWGTDPTLKDGYCMLP
jgi:hypothetical protein